ncbi:MAG: phytoene desaturase family protein [Candidatus Methanofastidiosia archaeon]
MIVIGGGLGGLLTAAIAAKSGNVILFERSSNLGGRFRNIQFKGYALTTGALHMVPHGSEGPLAQILAEVGAKCTIVDSSPWGTFLLDGKEHRFTNLRHQLPFLDKLRISKLITEMRFTKGPKGSVEDMIRDRFNEPIYLEVVRCILGWAVSCHPSDVQAKELYSIVRNIFNYGGPGVPLGGCSGVIRSLEDVLLGHNVSIVHKEVKKIVVDDKKAIGVETTDGDFYPDETIVSDVGIKKTVGMCRDGVLEAEYVRGIMNISESGGIKINIAVSEPFIRHSGVLFPLGSARVEGMNQVTNIDPSLAPKGKHLVMCHQTLMGHSIRKEIKKGITDIEEAFPKKDFEVLCAQSYFGMNPVNRAAHGLDVSQKFPIEGVYIVGDSAKGEGGIEVEGIALGVMKLRSLLGI